MQTPYGCSINIYATEVLFFFLFPAMLVHSLQMKKLSNILLFFHKLDHKSTEKLLSLFFIPFLTIASMCLFSLRSCLTSLQPVRTQNRAWSNPAFFSSFSSFEDSPSGGGCKFRVCGHYSALSRTISHAIQPSTIFGGSAVVQNHQLISIIQDSTSDKGK